MPKKLINLAIAIIILLGLNAAPATVSAHQVKTDNGISAYLHVLPYDQPISGQATTIHISFSDRKGSFNLSDCSCQLLLKKDEKVKQHYLAKPSRAGATLTSTVIATFPSDGDYEISIEGSSISGKFKPFHLEYPIKAGNDITAGTQKPNNNTIFLIAVPGLLLIAITTYFRANLSWMNPAK